MSQTIEGFVGTSIDDAKLTSIHYRVFALISAGYFFDIANLVIFGALVPNIIHNGFASPAEVATVGSATLFGLFVGTVGQGEFTDRFGRKAVYQFNLLLFGVATIASAFAPNYLWLAVLRFIAGIGLGAEQPLCFAYAGEYAPKRIRGRILACIQLIGGAFSWPLSTLFALAVPRHARLARHLARARRLRAGRFRAALLAAGIAALAGHARARQARRWTCCTAWASLDRRLARNCARMPPAIRAATRWQ